MKMAKWLHLKSSRLLYNTTMVFAKIWDTCKVFIVDLNRNWNSFVL